MNTPLSHDMEIPPKPALNRLFRLQWEPVQRCHVLLYPEGMVRLNASAGAILTCCDGSASLEQIVATLEAQFGATGLRADIEALLAHAHRENWIL